jgi:hypothetical protein
MGDSSQEVHSLPMMDRLWSIEDIVSLIGTESTASGARTLQTPSAAGGITSRNFICPATEEACTDPQCKLGLCREIKRQDSAFVRLRMKRAETAPLEMSPFHSHRRLRGDAILFLVLLFGAALVCVLLNIMGYKV